MPDNKDLGPYATIRTYLGRCIGQRVVEITQEDQEEWEETKRGYIKLHFADGGTVTFYDVFEFSFEHPDLPEDAEDPEAPADA